MLIINRTQYLMALPNPKLVILYLTQGMNTGIFLLTEKEFYLFDIWSFERERYALLGKAQI